MRRMRQQVFPEPDLHRLHNSVEQEDHGDKSVLHGLGEIVKKQRGVLMRFITKKLNLHHLFHLKNERNVQNIQKFIVFKFLLR